MAHKYLDSFGDPALSVGPLSVWVHGFEYPHATDGWDGNWLSVTARCIGNGTSIIATGPFLDTVSFHRLRRELAPLYEKFEGEATLASAEPNLRVTFKAAGTAGQVKVVIEITPDHARQQHRFFETIDQSYLRDIQAGCSGVLRHFPMRDPESRGVQIER